MSVDPTRPLPEWWQTDPPRPWKREPARIPVIWLAELFTPTTIRSLIDGVRGLNSRQSAPQSQGDYWDHYRNLPDPAEWITSDRRQGGYTWHWRPLPTVRPEGSRLRSGRLQLGDRGEAADNQVPAGIGYILLELCTLTSTVTVLTAQFELDDDRARGLEGILNQLPAPWDGRGQAPAPGKGSWDVQQEVEEWRTSLRQEATDWLANRFPGSFHRLAPGRLPTIEFLVTGQLRPWEPDTGSVHPWWAEVLDLTGRDGYLQCTTIPSLRLKRTRPWSHPWSSGPDQRHGLVLATAEQEFTAEPADNFWSAWQSQDEEALRKIDATEALRKIILEGNRSDDRQLVYPVGELLVRWSLTALICELEEQIADIQDVADQASRERSAEALAATQRLLLQTGIDSRIVVNDIIRYAQAPGWANDVLDFTEVATPPSPRMSPPESPTPQGETSPAASLAESLRQGQITDGQRVFQLETDLREILSTSAELASASENIRLQRGVFWLTVIATIVAIVAATVAVIALILS